MASKADRLHGDSGALIAVAYLGIMIGLIALADRGLAVQHSWRGLALLAALHVGLGVLAGGLWVFALPIVAVALAVPFGHPNSADNGEVSVWVGLSFQLPLMFISLALGFAAATLRRRIQIPAQPRNERRQADG
jgi:hypothetical protein